MSFTSANNSGLIMKTNQSRQSNWIARSLQAVSTGKVHKTRHFNGLSALPAKDQDSSPLAETRPCLKQTGTQAKARVKTSTALQMLSSTCFPTGNCHPREEEESRRMRRGCSTGSWSPRAAAQQHLLGSNTLCSPQTPARVPRKLHVHKHHADPQPLFHKHPCPVLPCTETKAAGATPEPAGARAGQRG